MLFLVFLERVCMVNIYLVMPLGTLQKIKKWASEAYYTPIMLDPLEELVFKHLMPTT